MNGIVEQDGEAVAKRLSESLRHCVELEQEYDRLVAPRYDSIAETCDDSALSINLSVVPALQS